LVPNLEKGKPALLHCTKGAALAEDWKNRLEREYAMFLNFLEFVQQIKPSYHRPEQLLEFIRNFLQDLD
jgi:hypothetical protein